MLPAGSEVLRHRVLQGASAIERHDVLDDALSEGLRADHGGTAGVTQRTGDDLGGAGSLVIDQDR
jgi:hypothetical protein